MSEELKGRELGWDDEIEKGADYVLLPEGEYDFTIESFERGRFEGNLQKQVMVEINHR